MIFNFPATKFVVSNTLADQIRHMRSELEEIEQAMVNQESMERVTEEAIDLMHSTETFLRILANDGSNLGRVRRDTERKNFERRYYDL